MLFYPQISNAAETRSRDPGCNVPRGYDCATPGYERPVTLDEAVKISKRETVVYLYGRGLQAARAAAQSMSSDNGGRPLPAIAAPGRDIPDDAFLVLVLGKVVKHQNSSEPVLFYQRFINRGEVFALTWSMYDRIRATQ